MTKKKQPAKKSKPAAAAKTTTPATPPSCLAEALIVEARSTITPKIAGDYAYGSMVRTAMTAKQRSDFCIALAHFATLGWAYYHAREELKLP